MKAAFLADNNLCIRHRDGDRTNNKLSNLYTYFSGEETLTKEGEPKQILIMETNPQTNEVIKIWESLTEAAKEYGLIHNKLAYSTKKCKTIEGHKFEIYNAALDGLGLFDYTDGNHKLIVYDECGNIIDKVGNVTQASQITGQSYQTISDAIKSGETTAKGYRYKWQLSTANAPQPITDNTNDETKRARTARVIQYDHEGNVIKVYDNVREAAEAMKCDTQTILYCTIGKAQSAKGYIWRVEGDKFDKYKTPRAKRNQFDQIRVDVYDLEGNFIGNYESVTKAAKELGVNCGSLGKCLTGSARRVGNYVARKEGEPFSKHKTPDNRVFYQMRRAEDGNGFIVTKEWRGMDVAAKELGYSYGGLGFYVRANAKRAMSDKKPYDVDGYYYAFGSY